MVVLEHECGWDLLFQVDSVRYVVRSLRLPVIPQCPDFVSAILLFLFSLCVYACFLSKRDSICVTFSTRRTEWE